MGRVVDMVMPLSRLAPRQGAQPADASRVSMPKAVREIRTQAGVIRALLDEVDAVDPAFGAELEGQLIEELARLGCRILEAASAMSDSKRPR
jgi:hypothetical protein